MLDQHQKANINFSQLRLDIEQSERHLKLLDPTAESFIFAAFSEAPDSSGRPFQAKAPIREIWSALEYHQACGHGIFVTVNEMQGRRRRSNEVARIRCVHGDFDKSPSSRPPLYPSLLIETSRLAIGARKFQAYWFTDPDANLTVKEAEAINKSIALRFGADHRAIDVARVLRVAGTYHMKVEPHLVRVVEGNGQRYSRRELIAAFPTPPPTSLLLAPAQMPIISGDIHRFIEPLRMIPANDYGTWIPVGMALHVETNGSADGLSIWDAWSSTSEKYKPGECATKWRSFGRSGAGVKGGTIIHLASQNGWGGDRGGHHA